MAVDRISGNIADLIVENYTFQVVSDFEYLDISINESNSMRNEII